jgi:quercetin dioxygenase-like cupin family protein
MAEPILLSPGEGEAVADRAERTVRILLDHELLDVTWSRYEPGERGPDPHIHREHVDAFYVLEGELEFGLGPETTPVRAPAETVVLVPQNVIHTFRNESGARAFFLNFHAPSKGFAAYMRGNGDGFDSFDPPADGGRDPADVIVTRPGEGERFDRGNRVVMITAESPELSFNEIAFDSDFVVEPHSHDDQVDAFFVLAGDVAFAPDGRWTRAAPGTFTAAPPGSVHGFRSARGRAHLLNFHAPDAGFAASIRRQ